MATGPSPNDLTRQQLDELDTLLQRMLTQPGAKAPAPMPAVVPDTSWRTDKPTAAATNVPHLVPEPALMARRTPDPEPAAPVLMAPPPSAEPFPVKLFDPPPMEPEPEPIALTTAPPAAAFERIDLATLPPPPVPQPMPQPGVESSTGGFSPLALCNGLIEGALKLFGPPGRMLTTAPAKHVLGGIGVLLLIGSGLWIARGFGWLTLP